MHTHLYPIAGWEGNPLSANALVSIDALLRRHEFAQALGERVRDALVALAVAVLEVGGTETVVMAVVDRVRGGVTRLWGGDIGGRSVRGVGCPGDRCNG